ncbi:MAG: hypothetical protein FJ279_25250, partial [Planctomycetes bacterium]|nr:hypothetical protein [Planctomycetota bacterium]
MRRTIAVSLLALTLSAYAAPVEMPKNAAMLRVRLGLGDKETTDWSGEVKVSPGRVASIQGWRFAGDDKVTGNAWTVHTRQLPVTSSGERRKVQAGIPMPMGDNGLILTLADVASDTNVEFTTQQGNFAVALKELPLGQRRRFLDNRAEVERCAVSTQVSAAIEDEDYPAAAVAADGAVYLAYMAFARGKDFVGPREAMSEDVKDFSYLAQPTGGDRVWLRILRGGKWAEPVAITDGGEDLYKPAVAVDGTGRAWVFFSKNVGASKELTDGNWELMARS